MRHNINNIRNIDSRLIAFEKDKRQLPGISSSKARECFIKQVIDSTQRIKYVSTILNQNTSANCLNPSLNGFNPIKAAAWYRKSGNFEEAFWMVFLLTHFGRNSVTKWRLVNDIYSGLSSQITWNWISTKQNLQAFKSWLNQNITTLKKNGSFGNHRKYQSLDAYSKNGTGETFESYINWINTYGSHQSLVNSVKNKIGNDPKSLFHFLFKDMSSVIGFGRTGKFDYLTMVGKLGLIEIEPDLTYMGNSTGPVSGARELFGNQNLKPSTLESWLSELEQYLNLHFGMQVLEDAICNWQKNTEKYIYFGG